MKEVIIELTGKCNLDCSFCYNKNKKSSLDTNKIFEILEQIKRDGIKAVRFTGGEPFLRKI